MKLPKINLLRLTMILSIVLILSSCLTTKTDVGAYRETKGIPYKYAKGRQLWLFWGIVPLGKTKVNTPGDGNCQIVTRYNFGDGLISFFTLGIITSYSIKVKAKGKVKSEDLREQNVYQVVENTNARDYDFKAGDQVTFKNMLKLVEGEVIGVNNNTAVVKFATMMGSEKKKEVELEKLTKIGENIKEEIHTEEENNPPIIEEKTNNDVIYYKTKSAVNMRKGAGTSFEKITTLAIDTRVKLIDKSNSTWYKIEVNGNTGYVSSSYLIKD